MKPFKSSLFILLTLLALILSALGVTPAKAANTVVTNNADSGPGSLRNAIANASSGDTITFDDDYTITLASELQIINKTLTITGAGHHITISGNNAVQVFRVGDESFQTEDGNLTLDHLNIVNGKSTVELCAGSLVSCGGGLMLEYLTTATVSNSTFSNNDGGMAGGAIYSYYGNLTVINSTFINNQALAYGGGVETFYGHLTLTNNTFIGNSAGGYGGGVLNTFGAVTFRNNIFANNSAANGPNCDAGQSTGGTFYDEGGNLVWGSIDACPGVRADPRLGSLDDYGGDVPTLPLLPGSAALSAASANCPSVDARGVTRSSTCASGAFESQGFTLTKSGGDSQFALINTAFTNPLLVTVTANNAADPVDGGIVSFTSPASGAGAALTGSQATISGGAVSVSATSNGTIGSYNVTASSGGAANVDFALTNLLAPTAITSTASAITTTGATLSGTVNANDYSTTVDFEYGLSTAYGSTASADQSPVTGSVDTAMTATLTGLTPNTIYHFRIKAVKAGFSNLGADQVFTTHMLVPTAITGTASAITMTGAALNGTVNAQGGSAVVTFEYGKTMTYGSTVIAIQSPVSGAADRAVSAALTGLTTGSIYHFRVKAVTAGGTTLGADKTFTTSFPAPTATTSAAANVTTSSVKLNGIVNARGGNATVTFQCGLTTAYGSTFTATPGQVSGAVNTSVSATVTGLKPNTTYHFRVKAVTSGGTTLGVDMTFKTAVMTQHILNWGLNTYTGASIVPDNWIGNANLLIPDGKDLSVKQEGLASIKMVGNGKLKTLTQKLSLSGALGDLFVFSFWNKGISVPVAGMCTAQVFFFNGTGLVGARAINCDTGTYAWKHEYLTFTAPAAYTSIQVRFSSAKLTGTIWFDTVILLK
jgi:hypothetical protein